ncbi:RDD family protein [uncultured Arenimonas sp.]|uniref:RDD family protein n=1 Tax=uncultured Arenimonas sp. TaxID=546226 RepID=UPI0030DBD6F5
MRPAGFLRRYAAYSLDLVVPVAVSVPLLWRTGQKMMARTWQHMAEAELRLYDLMALSESRGAHALADLPGWSSDPALRKALLAMVAAWLEAIGIAALVIAALAALWFIAFEASPWQASPGKRLAGLRVVRRDGGRPGPGRVALRFGAGAPSWLLLHVGHAIAAIRRDGRALHDLLAGTHVVLAPGATTAMPRWARYWLWLQALAVAALVMAVGSQYVLLAIEAWKAGQP